MNGFHSYFVTPKVRQGKVRFAKFELLTWIASAVQWKRLYGGLDFITDAEGLLVLSKLGFGGLYDAVKVLDTPFNKINPSIFWAAGKIVAMKHYVGYEDVYSVDTDCILWKHMKQKSGLALVGLNYDNPEFYKVVTEHYRNDLKGWGLKNRPINAAILGFNGYCGDGSLLDVFTSVSLKFMETVSRRANLDSASMIFAEQKLSAEVCSQMGLEYGVLCHADASTGWHIDCGDIPYITHLWDTKDTYRQSQTHRDAYISWLSDRICPVLGRAKSIWERIYNENDIVEV